MPTGSPIALLEPLHLVCRASRAGGTPGMAAWGHWHHVLSPSHHCLAAGSCQGWELGWLLRGRCHHWGILSCLLLLLWT